MHIETIDDERAFSVLGEEWNALLAASRQDNPFLRHEWLHAWWGAFRDDARLALLVCREDGSDEIVGVLPLYATGGRRPFGPLTLRLLGDRLVGSTGLGAFARADLETPVMDLFVEHLRKSRGEYDVLDFRVMHADGAFFERCAELRLGGGGNRRADQVCPLVALPGDWDSYLARCLCKSARRSVRRSRQKTEEVGAEFEILSDAASVPGALDDYVRLFEGRMRALTGRPFGLSRANREFVSQVSPRLLADGRLRLGFLVIDGRRVATDYELRYGDTMYSLQGGFDMAYADLAVMKALLSHLIENAIAEGCRYQDFGRGDQEYKRTWGVTGERRLCDLRVYGASSAARLTHARDVSVDGVASILAAAPSRIGEPVSRVGRAVVRRFRR